MSLFNVMKLNGIFQGNFMTKTKKQETWFSTTDASNLNNKRGDNKMDELEIESLEKQIEDKTQELISVTRDAANCADALSNLQEELETAQQDLKDEEEADEVKE